MDVHWLLHIITMLQRIKPLLGGTLAYISLYIAYSTNYAQIHVCSVSLWFGFKRFTLPWHHNGRDGISNHQPRGCLLYDLASKDYTHHYRDIIMGAMAFQITSLAVVYSTIYSGADQRKHKSSASPVNYPHKGPVTRKWLHLMTSSLFFNVHSLRPGQTQDYSVNPRQTQTG